MGRCSIKECKKEAVSNLFIGDFAFCSDEHALEGLKRMQSGGRGLVPSKKSSGGK